MEGGAAGTPRTFQLVTANKKDRQVVWESKLAHNSCLKVDAHTNRTLKHAVPPRAKGEPHCKRWSLVCHNVVSSIRQSTDPKDVRSANYLVTSPKALQDWGYPSDFAFPFAESCSSIITWKDGTSQHLCDLIDMREKTFYRSQLKNEAIANLDAAQLDKVFEWAKANGVGENWPSKQTRERFHNRILERLYAHKEDDEAEAEPAPKKMRVAV